MAALTDGGVLEAAPSQVVLTGVIPVVNWTGVVINNRNGVHPAGLRNTSMAVGMIVETFNNPYGGDSLTVPGFALRKGLRVLTLDENQRKAYSNVVQ